ncbi:hypothetical protein E4V01_24615 [Methylorubrum sp. Q1]|uniref:hypothetical protein n=1 Tax=Methylorubrum sp. Q1 TaxID=2562453 RepID=UPI001075EF5D|nr:hypothetical protein [Methylorubrum sp. Q1]TFZ54796.1 hypothetical protein E4V01_24615 [Methylorubrum sp. Q1]
MRNDFIKHLFKRVRKIESVGFVQEADADIVVINIHLPPIRLVSCGDAGLSHHQLDDLAECNTINVRRTNAINIFHDLNKTSFADQASTKSSYYSID